MNNFNFNRSTNIENITPQAAARTRSLMTYTFGWMFLAMIISTIGTLIFRSNPALMDYLVNVDITGRIHRTALYWIIALAPIAFILVMSFGFNRLSFISLLGLFLLYSACTGVSLSVLLSFYDGAVIAKAFGSAAGLFGLMAVVGFTTKTDLTNFGRILMLGLVALIISSIVNYFIGSSFMEYIISIVGVAIFTGLTAYDVQKIKRIAAQSDGSETFMKLSVMAAFNLYLDFINLFLFLLRIFGRRD